MLRKPQDSWLNGEGSAFPRMQNAIQSKQNLSVSVDTPCQALVILAEILYTLIAKLFAVRCLCFLRIDDLFIRVSFL